MDQNSLQEKARLEVEKLGLEIEKTRLDLADARRRWFQKPAYLAASAPILIAAVSAVPIFNLLQARTDALTAKSDRLQIEISHFESQRNALADSVATERASFGIVQRALEDSLSSLSIRVQQAELDATAADSRADSAETRATLTERILETDLADLQRAINELSDEKSALYTEVIDLQAERDTALMLARRAQESADSLEASLRRAQ